MNERGGSLGSFDAYNNALVFSVERFELLHGIAGAGVRIRLHIISTMGNASRQYFIAFISVNNRSNTREIDNFTLVIDVSCLKKYYCNNYD